MEALTVLSTTKHRLTNNFDFVRGAIDAVIEAYIGARATIGVIDWLNKRLCTSLTSSLNMLVHYLRLGLLI